MAIIRIFLLHTFLFSSFFWNFLLLEDRPPEWCAYILHFQGKRNVGIEIIQSITRYSETFSYQERNYERFVKVLLTGGTDGFGEKQWQSLLTTPLGVMSATTAGTKWKSENSGLNGMRAHGLCGASVVLCQLSYEANWELGSNPAEFFRLSFYHG